MSPDLHRTPHRNDAARLTDDEARELRRRVARDGAYRTARELGTSTTMLDKLLGGCATTAAVERVRAGLTRPAST